MRQPHQHPRAGERPGRAHPWAELLQRVWGFDVLACPCGGRRILIAFINRQATAQQILAHLGLPSTGPPRAKAVVPAWQQELLELPGDDQGRDPQYPDDGAQAPSTEVQ